MNVSESRIEVRAMRIDAKLLMVSYEKEGKILFHLKNPLLGDLNKENTFYCLLLRAIYYFGVMLMSIRNT